MDGNSDRHKEAEASNDKEFSCNWVRKPLEPKITEPSDQDHGGSDPSASAAPRVAGVDMNLTGTRNKKDGKNYGKQNNRGKQTSQMQIQQADKKLTDSPEW